MTNHTDYYSSDILKLVVHSAGDGEECTAGSKSSRKPWDVCGMHPLSFNSLTHSLIGRLPRTLWSLGWVVGDEASGGDSRDKHAPARLDEPTASIIPTDKPDLGSEASAFWTF